MTSTQTQNQNQSPKQNGDKTPESVDALKQAGKDIGSTARQAGEDLRSTASDSAREVREAAERDAARFAEIAREWWHRNAMSANEAAQAVRGETAALSRRTESYVRDEPMKSVLIAAAVGAFVAACFVGSRRD